MPEPRPPDPPDGQPAYPPPQEPPYPSAAGWGQPRVGWGPARESEHYGSSIVAILAGLLLVVIGLPAILVGGFLAFFGGRLFEGPFSTGAQVGIAGGGSTIFGTIILIIGILHLLSGIFAWMHRSWARYIGMILGALGVFLGAFGLVSSTGPETSTSQQAALVASFLIVMAYALVIVGLAIGGRHFRKARVE